MDDVTRAIHDTAPELDIWTPVGETQTYEEQNDSGPRTSTVVAFDKNKDLALLESHDSKQHPWTSVGTFPRVFEKVAIVGHPYGIWWTDSVGWVSVPHSEDPGLSQIMAPVYPGNSGGGAFDYDGRLVGICHSVVVIGKSPTNISYFVDRDQIMQFLRESPL
jgi:S1-C subfamily serine protease